MVFGSVGPVFTFCQKKIDTINFCFKLRLIGFASFYVKNIYQNKLSMTTHCTPQHTHTYITYRFRYAGPGANKSAENVGPV